MVIKLQNNGISILYPKYIIGITFLIALFVLVNELTVHKINGIISTIDIGSSPYGIAYNPSNQLIYVTTYNSLSIINNNTVIKNVSLGDQTNSIFSAYDPLNEVVLVTDLNSNNISTIDDNFEIDNFFIGKGSYGVTFNPDNNFLYITSPYNKTIHILDSLHEYNRIEELEIATGPTDIVFNPMNGKVYFSNFDANIVSVIDPETNELSKNITFGTSITSSDFYSLSLAYNPYNNLIYVSSMSSNIVYVIDPTTDTVVNEIIVGNAPTGIAFNPSDNHMYVANYDSKSISVIDSKTNTVVKDIIVGLGPVRMAYNPSNGLMYVVNSDSGTISTIGFEDNQ
jgi:YVTN family beta-propeller protein